MENEPLRTHERYMRLRAYLGGDRDPIIVRIRYGRLFVTWSEWRDFPDERPTHRIRERIKR